MFRTVGDQQSLWESILPEEVRRHPDELARVNALLDDPAFFTPFVPFFDPQIGRPSTPMETYLRLMFLKFRYRLGYESLCREVSDSITWRMFCRIPLDVSVPHPSTLMKLTTRCGSAAVDGLNETLLAKAAEAKLLCTNRIRADTTVVPANVGYPTDSGCWPRRFGGSPRPVSGSRPPAARCAPGCGIGPRRRASARTPSHRNCALARHWAAMRSRPRCSIPPVNWSNWPKPRRVMPSGCWSTPSGRCAGPWPRPPPCAPVANMTRRLAGVAAAWCARSRTWPSWWPRPARSPRRPGNGCPDTPDGTTRGGSACTMAMPARSPRPV
ncbi:hypothetical protein I552_2127 [Mycobacterium xenopi 3993]|nr:hypothetical protein I552_2127 [Mycobacterium xenopi 3993]